MKVRTIVVGIFAILLLIFSMCDRQYPDYPPQPVEPDGGYGKAFIFFGQTQHTFKAEADAVAKQDTESDDNVQPPPPDMW